MTLFTEISLLCPFKVSELQFEESRFQLRLQNNHLRLASSTIPSIDCLPYRTFSYPQRV